MLLTHRHPASLILMISAITGLQVSVAAEDWPWFLGLRHDGTSAEAEVSLKWPQEGPPILWKKPVGEGYSAPSIVGDRLVVHYRDHRDEVVSCRSVETGDELWRHSYRSDYEDPYGYNNGPRCSPVIANGRCFTLGAAGILCCTNLETGKPVWQRDLQSDFDLPDWFFGIGCSPILDGDRLIVLVGGQENSGVVAFSVEDGKTLWEAVGRETWDGVTDANTGRPYSWTGKEMVVSYSSPVIADIHGKRHLLCLMRHGLVSLNPETGDSNFRYWFRPKVHESVNAARPVVVGNKILLSAAYRLGSVLLEVGADGDSVTEVWKSDENLLAHWSTPIHSDGFVYGFSGRHENESELRCIRLTDGAVMWTTSGFSGNTRNLGRDRSTGHIVDTTTGQAVPFPYYGRGSLIQVGSHFIVLGERGTLAVVRVNSQKFQEERRTFFDEIGYPSWTAPVLSGARLYLRSEDWLICVDLRPSDP